MFSHSSRGWDSEIKVLAGLSSLKRSRRESFFTSPCFWWLWDSAPQPCESQLCARYSAGQKRRQRINLQSTRDANAVFKQSRAITFSQKCKQESSFVKWVSERCRWGVCVCVCMCVYVCVCVWEGESLDKLLSVH